MNKDVDVDANANVDEKIEHIKDRICIEKYNN
jgi:hypothetical protein